MWDSEILPVNQDLILIYNIQAIVLALSPVDMKYISYSKSI